MFLRKWLTVPMTVLCAGALVACSSSEESGNADEGLTTVSLRMPWLMRGYMAPFNLAYKQGYYRDVGLNVEIGEGRGSVTTAQTVANGSDEFGFVDATSAAMLIAEGAPIKVIAVFQQQTAASFIYRGDEPVKKPEDLLDRPIVHSASDNVTTLAPAVLAEAGMAFDDLESIVVEPAAAVQTMVNTPNSVLLANANSTYVDVLALEPSAEYTLFSDLGVNVYGFALITSNDMIKNRTDVVQAIVDASVKGWQEAAMDPEAAIDATVEAFPDVDPDIQMAQLQATLPLMHTPATQDRPVGWMDPADWEETIKILQDYAGLEGGPPVDEYYTNQFISES